MGQDKLERQELFSLGEIEKAVGKSRTTLINLEYQGIVKFGRLGGQRYGSRETIQRICNHYANKARKAS